MGLMGVIVESKLTTRSVNLNHIGLDGSDKTPSHHLMADASKQTVSIILSKTAAASVLLL